MEPIVSKVSNDYMDDIVGRSTLNLVLFRGNGIISTQTQKLDNENSSDFQCRTAWEIAFSPAGNWTLFHSLNRGWSDEVIHK